MSDGTFRRALLGVCVLGFALRLAYALVIVRGGPLLGDGLEFQQQANLLASGHGLIQPGPWYTAHIARPTADKPPLYPVLEAALSLLGARTWPWHQLVGVLAGTATVAVTGLLARRVAGSRPGLLAAALAATYPLLIATDGSLRSESVFALLVTVSLLAALRVREAATVERAAALGAVIGLAALTRAEALLLLVLLPFGRAGWRSGAVSVLTCLVVLSPWVARCWIAFGRPVLISTNVGGLLAGANCPRTYSGPFLGQWVFACLPPPSATNEAQQSDRWRDDGLRYARRHVGRLPVVIAARLGRSFDLFRPAQNWNIEAFFEGRNLRTEKVGVIIYYAVALLAIAGVVVLVRRGGPWWILCSPLVLVLFVSITAYGFTRFRAGAEPALIVLAAVAIDALVRRRGPTRRPAGAVMM